MGLSAFDLTGKVAIVTGGGRGIGKAIALGMAQAGADVVVAARTASEIETTAEEIRALGRKTRAIPTDVRQVNQVTGLLRETLASFNRVDILVNNAGGALDAAHQSPGAVLQMRPDTWQAMFTQNLDSTFICCKTIGGQMVQQRAGSIINISSTAGLGPQPRNAHYAAAKAGVISFTRTLAVEWGPYNIRVNAIAPGFVDTPLMVKFWEEHADRRHDILKKIPLGRFGKPEDIIPVAVFLASDAASYMTGETIVASGGLTTTVFD